MRPDGPKAATGCTMNLSSGGFLRFFDSEEPRLFQKSERFYLTSKTMIYQLEIIEELIDLPDNESNG